MAKTVLVTGATGTVGCDVTKQLSRKGPAVRAGVRDRVKARKRFGDEIDLVPFDFQDVGSFGGVLDGVGKFSFCRP